MLRRAGFDTPESVVDELLYHLSGNDLLLDRKEVLFKNLATKVAKGIYDTALAVKAFAPLVDGTAYSYALEYGGERGRDWKEMFPRDIRNTVATKLVEEFEQTVEGAGGELLKVVPKRYQSGPALRDRMTSRRVPRDPRRDASARRATPPPAFTKDLSKADQLRREAEEYRMVGNEAMAKKLLQQADAVEKKGHVMRKSTKRTAGFMEPMIYEDTYVTVDGPMGSNSFSAEYADLAEVEELQREIEENGEVDLSGTSLADYTENDVAYDIDVKKGFGAQLSAPGYMDQTDLVVFDTLEEAKDYLLEEFPEAFGVGETVKALADELGIETGMEAEELEGELEPELFKMIAFEEAPDDMIENWLRVVFTPSTVEASARRRGASTTRRPRGRRVATSMFSSDVDKWFDAISGNPPANKASLLRLLKLAPRMGTLMKLRDAVVAMDHNQPGKAELLLQINKILHAEDLEPGDTYDREFRFRDTRKNRNTASQIGELFSLLRQALTYYDGVEDLAAPRRPVATTRRPLRRR